MSDNYDHIIQKLERFIERDNFKGYDPYDGLNSRFLNFLTLQKKWPRIAVIQFMKRSRMNLRPLFGIQKMNNPKAMGILASAFLLRYKHTHKGLYLDKARKILDWLISHSTGSSGYAWGHNFNWQSSIFYVPRGIPTVVNTVFIANAFVDAYTITKEESYLEIARSSCDFILNDLNRTPLQSSAKGIEQSAKGKEQRAESKEHGAKDKNNDTMTNDSMTNSAFCFSYTPLDSTCTHNANLLAVELLTRVNYYKKEKILLENASMALNFTLSLQNPNGSWFYGTGKKQRYIDNFHTGFVLVSLANIAEYSELDDARYMRNMKNAYNFYKLTFFEKNGKPHYYHNRIYPVDLHCSAQGIITYLRFKKMDQNAVKIAQNIADWAMINMWDHEKGYFYFQKTKLFTNRISYLRWPNAWMYLALAKLAEHGAEGIAQRE